VDAAMTELAKEVVEAIKTFVAESPGNRFAAIDGSPIFVEPLVGFADGDDPLFRQYKEVVGDFHLTPREVVQMHLKETGGDHEEFGPLTAISWILPVAEETRRSNRPMNYGPSVRWNQTRWAGEDFNKTLKKYVVGFLTERGYRALSPGAMSFTKTLVINGVRTSNWSERHIAYAAGLGTFGLTDALITSKGVAHRVGSVLVEASLPPTPRPYQDHHAYCPYFQDGSCGVCIERCPTGALSARGHDKIRCHAHVEQKLASWAQDRKSEGYMGAYPGCGLCMTNVPCEAEIPPACR